MDVGRNLAAQLEVRVDLIMQVTGLVLAGSRVSDGCRCIPKGAPLNYPAEGLRTCSIEPACGWRRRSTGDDHRLDPAPMDLRCRSVFFRSKLS
jgi:hypothetical protein